MCCTVPQCCGMMPQHDPAWSNKIRGLPTPGDGMLHAQSMSMNINTTILQEISFQLHNGNPWWGLALCNEYMSQHSPLRRAIIQRFTARIGEHGASSKIAKLLIRGQRKGELPAELQHALGSRSPRLHNSTALASRSTDIRTRCTSKRTVRVASRARPAQTPRYSSRVTPTIFAQPRKPGQSADTLRASSSALCIVTRRS